MTWTFSLVYIFLCINIYATDWHRVRESNKGGKEWEANPLGETVAISKDRSSEDK